MDPFERGAVLAATVFTACVACLLPRPERRAFLRSPHVPVATVSAIVGTIQLGVGVVFWGREFLVSMALMTDHLSWLVSPSALALAYLAIAGAVRLFALVMRAEVPGDPLVTLCCVILRRLRVG